MPKLSIPPTKTLFGCIRLLEREDLPLTLEWRNRDEIRKWFCFSEVITQQSHFEWFDRYLKKPDDFTFVMTVDDAPIGQIALYNWDKEAQTIEIGRIMVGDNRYLGKGLAKESIEKLVEVAANLLGCCWVKLEVKENNDRAISLYQKCGFEVRSTVNSLVEMVKGPLAPTKQLLLNA
ncbi:MAG: GNAT family N-acetyltransferase [Pirellula sp.]|nr:GNAT family N-acetyltransferase [Pirellula sp.]